MASRSETIFNETRRLACRVLDDDNAAAAFLSRGLRTNPVGIVVATGLGNLRDNARNFACGAGAPIERVGDALFGNVDVSGQCPVDYRINVVVDRYFSNGTLRVEGATFSSANPFRGPIESVFIDNNDASTITVRYNNGVEGPLFSNGSSDRFRDLRDVTYERLDGQPDDCGGEFDPRPTYEGPVTYQDDNGNDVTENVRFNLDDPVGNPGGGLTIPFGWFAPELEINPNLNLDLEPEVDFSPTPGCRPQLDLPELDIPEGEDDPPEPEDNRLLAGVIIATTVESPNAVGIVYGNSFPPKVYLPDMGTIVFAVKVGSTEAWTKPYPIQVLRQWEPVLGELFAYSFRIINRNGFVSIGYPIYIDDGDTES